MSAKIKRPPPNPHIQLIRASDAYNAVKLTPSCWVMKEAPATEGRKECRLRGVRRILEQRVWPSYDYHRAERLNPTPSSMRVRTGVRNARQGTNRGSAVHEQLHAIAVHGLLGAEAMYAKRHIDIEPLVVLLIQHFYNNGLRLIEAELPVHDASEPLRIGSSIDLVCERKDNQKLVLIELKVGGDNYFKKASGAMEAELTPYNIPNSPLNKALIQLLAYRLLFERCYTNVVPRDAVDSYRVIFLGESGIVHRVLTEQTAATLAAPLLAALSAAGATNNNSRRAQSRGGGARN